MQQVVTITQQGQLTIPKMVRDRFGIRGAVKAVLQIEDDTIMVKPQGNFWSLSGSLKSRVKLTDKQLKKARASFSKSWARNV